MTRNAIFLLMYNTSFAQLELSKQAYESALAQDVGPVHIFLVNNGSTEPTVAWMSTLEVEEPNRLTRICYPVNVSPSRVSNEISAKIFADYPAVLGMPNDVILPANLYRELLTWPRGFVAAFMNGDRANIKPCVRSKAVHDDVHMSVMMTRRWAYQALMDKDGYFLDEEYFLYASDVDLKLRMAGCGITGVQLDIECYHYGSACWRLAAPGIGKVTTDHADLGRAYFHKKWGFPITDPQIGEMIRDISFKG